MPSTKRGQSGVGGNEHGGNSRMLARLDAGADGVQDTEEQAYSVSGGSELSFLLMGMRPATA